MRRGLRPSPRTFKKPEHIMKTTHTAKVMTGLWRVKDRKKLRWPVKIIDPQNSRGAKFASNLRGGQGYVVNMDLPEEGIFCRGQEKFLEECLDNERTRASVISPPQFPKPVVNWMIKNGFLSSSARKARRPKAQVEEREKSAVPPPKVLPGLSITPEMEPVRTPRPKPQEPTDAVEGQKDDPGF